MAGVKPRLLLVCTLGKVDILNGDGSPNWIGLSNNGADDNGPDC